MLRSCVVFLLTIATAYGQTNPEAEKPESLFQQIESSDPAVQPARTLLKIGASLPILRQSSFNGYYAAISLDFIAEQKLYKGLTVLAGLENTFGLALDGRTTTLYALEMPVALRYYFSWTRRQEQRADRHSFFSPYVGFQTHNILFSELSYARSIGYDLAWDYRRTVPRTNVNFLTNRGRVGDHLNFMEMAYLQVGSQHKIFNKKGYLDINIILPLRRIIYNKQDYTMASPGILNIKLGYNLAIKSRPRQTD